MATTSIGDVGLKKQKQYMNKEAVLIIFTKNPELGKCKTRLAQTIGDEKALKIYELLLDYTISFTTSVPVKKHVYYSDTILENDRWSIPEFEKFLQIKGDLGTKMSHAIHQSFKSGYKKVVIIGSDCAEINEKTINKAFQQLKQNDVVIGPATDGGYYLLGMNQPILDLFIDKSWSTPKLISETIACLKRLDHSFYLLPKYSDIDYEADLMRPNFLNLKNG